MISRRLVAFIAFCISVLFPAMPASAHPLGNFTINHLAKVRIDADRMQVADKRRLASCKSGRKANGRLSPPVFAWCAVARD
jgi:hypothetical protein